MRLVAVSFGGYKRFSRSSGTRLNADGKVIAIVGPNEAGKTSILDGLLALNDESAIPSIDLTRGESRQPQPLIEARYWLDEDDLDAIAYLTDEPLRHRWFELFKYQDGELRAVLETPIARNLDQRHQAGERVRKLGAHKWLQPFREARRCRSLVGTPW